MSYQYIYRKGLMMICLLLTLKSVGQQVMTPDKLFGQLFTDVQLSGIFPDSKTFADCIPKRDPKEIVADYMKVKNNPAISFSLQLFMEENFDMPAAPAVLNYVMQEKDLGNHVRNLWSVLEKPADTIARGSSLIVLPHAYVVSGGRFMEMNYRDAYFIMLGLKESGRADMMDSIVRNGAWLIKKYGYIPEGNRSYYLGRSQPPFFSFMVQLLAEVKGEQVLKTYLPALKKEYDFWMDKSGVTKHRVTMPDGSVLNRYYDRFATTRAEAYSTDMAVTDKLGAAQLETMNRNIRAAAEAGWSRSNRWMTDPADFNSLQTTSIVPIDLNCLLYELEMLIASVEKKNGSVAVSTRFSLQAAKRKKAIIKYCWNKQLGFFCDYNISKMKIQPNITAAGMFPLFTRICTQDQADTLAATAMAKLVKPGGLVNTEISGSMQSDAPNGWAYLQWITVIGARNYGLPELAVAVGKRWIELNEKWYESTGKLFERYNVVNIEKEPITGEYPAQEGFGPTNGVYLALKAMFNR